MNNIAVIDYGMGNLRSVAKALEYVAQGKARVQVTSDAREVLQADRVVFPGQGAARDCMRALIESGLDLAVREAVELKPFLGICMGMQVLVESSAENNGTECLNIFPGKVSNFADVLNSPDDEVHYKIPHMGWNEVTQTRDHPLWGGIAQNSRFYFVHSYYLEPEGPDLLVGETEYGIRFTSAIARDNVFAIQCHPEKSAAAGLRLLENFTRWNGEA